MVHRKKVVIGFLGTKLDSGLTEKRWARWRPTVALFGHGSFVPDELELLTFNGDYPSLVEQVTADVLSLKPDARVRSHDLTVSDAWSFQQVYAALHEFAKGYTFREDTDYYVHLTTGTHVAQICLFLLTEARYLPARIVETSMSKRGSDVEEWRGRLELIDLDLSTYDQLAKRFQKESVESQDLLKGGIVTRNAAFNALIGRLERVALKSTAPLLLTGPTGAGKSALAQRVYELRSRRHLVAGAFVEVNCATLRGDNAMSALFGHKKGAFTGAVSDRPGLLRAADGGTLFLDEIGELGLDEQAMLLRALEDKRFLPMGSDKEVSSDFQLLAGTNRNLAKDVAEGRFRADLLARINVWQFKLPGLAERPEDIEPNLDFELERVTRELGTRISISREARERFLAFALEAPWPGNFRDLAAAVTRMATLADGGRISEDDVEFECEQLQAAWEPADSSEGQTRGNQVSSRKSRIDAILAERSLDRFERVQLVDVLQVIAETGSMAEAGRVLYAESRAMKANPNDSDRVRKFLARYDLDYTDAKQRLTA
ncbi:transcriptional regulator [Burkholderia ubonensis]|uniref:RNA repair transcriptional activator RtcR n=1 Tax=Burkholderia ubonensis TaxID=101571 RepID=UPI00075DD1AF|nr:RNA repair transcriptional activator RtcR [Burkholderia ubonensis]KVP96670.1 transcriptional regulator [Burkholderia ubonensis]